MKLVIVESPAKAKTLNKYLGKSYKVIASFGHICDVPSKNGSVIPEEDFRIIYTVPEKSLKHVEEIKKQALIADEVYLATDPDREGEAISWHVTEVLKQENIVRDSSKFKRITFNEITKKAVLYAIEHPRAIDQDLVNAQQARRALDYLVGFTLSPLLWRKLPGCKSAGRVQSVALRMICEREDEIERFIPQEFWDIKLGLSTPKGTKFIATLSHIDQKKLEKFSLTTSEQANEIALALRGQSFSVHDIQKKQQKRAPAAPFITSSLQQEASRKLGFNAKKTMLIAQKLYEGVEIKDETVGLITYMRTDGVTLSNDAVAEIRELILAEYGKNYLPSAPRAYKSKAKNAQEAHEAIRPTDIKLTPSAVMSSLDKDQFALYELIWKRTMACQMENAIIDMVGVDLLSSDGRFIARATGSTVAFDGFYKLYREGSDDDQDEENKMLPPLNIGDVLSLNEIDPQQHFTMPPPRYSEASLVKNLEELGIGRPSTYASIISVLQDRKYVTLEKKRFIPDDRGRLVIAFLVGFFPKYVEYDFTAELETDLDKIASGDMIWKELLKNFWTGFASNVDQVSEKKISEVIEYVQKALDFHLFGDSSSPKYAERRLCTSCKAGELELKLGKYGSFLACNKYPDCTYKKAVISIDNSDGSAEDFGALEPSKELGKDDLGNVIYLKKGPYGWYVQLGDVPEVSTGKGRKKTKPKRCQIPNGVKPEDVTFESAISLLSLPMEVGHHPESGEKVEMGIGRFGPYLKYQGVFYSIPKVIDPFKVTMEQAQQIFSRPKRPKAKKDANVASDNSGTEEVQKKTRAKKKTTTTRKSVSTKTSARAKKSSNK